MYELKTLQQIKEIVGAHESLIVPGLVQYDFNACITHDKHGNPIGWIIEVKLESPSENAFYCGLNGKLRVFKTLHAVHKALLSINIERFTVYTVG